MGYSVRFCGLACVKELVPSIVGGLAGEAREIRVMNCYAASEVFPLEAEDRELLIGGLFGDIWRSRLASLTIGCFWDTELSGIAVSTGSDPLELGIGLSTEQMMDEDVFRSAGWDLKNVWMISEGDYPRLQWEIED